MESLLLSRKDAAVALGVSVRTLENLIASKELTPRRIGRRCLLERRELERFARRNHDTQRNRNDGDGLPVSQ
jgi:excisionase family DNA binding protein